MTTSPAKTRISFQAKVLVPVIAVMVLLTIVTIWFVNRRISDQLEKQAAAQLEKDHAIFTKFQQMSFTNLLSKYRSVSVDVRYKSLLQKAEDSPAWYQTVGPFLHEQASANCASMATFAFDNAVGHGFAHTTNAQIDAQLFQARSSAAIRRAFEGQPVTDTINVGPALLNIVCVPVADMYDQNGVVTFGEDIGQEAVRFVKQLKGSEILILADGKIIASSLQHPESHPELIAQFKELSAARDSSQPRTQKAIINGSHYLCEAASFDSLGNNGSLGYLSLSSYEESWAVLKATQQMLFVIGLIGIALSSVVVCFLVGKVTAPLRQLRNSVEAVGRGDFSRRVEVTSQDECGELADAFNQMTGNLKVSREELEKTVATLKSTQGQLIQSEKLSGIGEFVAGVAHELNNPLTSVMGFSELLQQSDMPEQQRRYLDVIFKSAKRCQKIVQSLLSFARRHAPERKVVCMNEIVESAVEILQYQMRTSNIEVLTQLDPRLPATELDPHQMQQVFLNIINNARQAMEGNQPKGCLRITTESSNGWVRVIFKDNGPGIPAENLKRIFNPFFTTKEVGKGTGLGLSLCYGIVSEHGGAITPYSEPGDGATFVIELPVTKTSAAPVEQPATPVREENSQDGVGKRVLVIDDEDLILQMISEVLTRNGYKVDIARDGEAALRRLGQYHYDLALCDWKMPGLNGQEIYNRLLASNPEMSRRMIFITGDVVNEKVQEFLRSQHKVCLSKPFTLVEFRSAISQVITSN